MKFLFYFAIVTISLAIGECLQCYNCYQGNHLYDKQINNELLEYGASTPNEKCFFPNGQITGPTCQSNICVDLLVQTNNEKVTYHFCSKYNESKTKTFSNISNNNFLSITSKTCSENLCNTGKSLGIYIDNGASSIFKINLLTIVLSLFFFHIKFV